MAKHQGKSKLAAKYGTRFDSSLRKHAKDKTDYGEMRLPPGIKNGVAQLSEIKFDTYKRGDNQGEFYCQMRGVVVAPQKVNTSSGEVTVAGRQTMKMFPLCATKARTSGKVTSAEENIADLLNEFRKLGGEDFTEDVDTLADLEDLADELVEMEPYFKFETQQSAPNEQFPNPQVFENWFGAKGLENYIPPDDDEAESDDTEAEEVEEDEDETPKKKTKGKMAKVKDLPTKKRRPEPEEDNDDEEDDDELEDEDDEEEETPAPKAKGGKVSSRESVRSSKTPRKSKAIVEDEEEDQPFDEFGDLDSLADKANDDDMKARKELLSLATKYEVPKKLADKAENWNAVVDLIKEYSSDNEDTDEDEDEEEEDTEDANEVSVEDVMLYHPVDKRTGKKAKKPVQVEVVKTNISTLTATVKDLTDGVTLYKNVPWSDLESMEEEDED